MEKVVLQANRREVVGKQVRALRRQGLLPAVIYGHHIQPINIVLDAHEAGLVLPRLSSSQLVVVEVNGERHNALVREKQRHPVTDALIHVDFHAVSMTEKLRVMVSIEFVGEAPAVKNFNGIVVPSKEELEIECLPDDLPNRIVVDLGELAEIGDAIHVRDISLPPRVTVLEDPDEVIVVITAPITEAELEAAETVAGVEPEVIEKGKKEEEDFD
ncbi:MAG: 50S ribosomal protein L25 [Anaerolineales bacterium]|nr:50S ribosomal protein L25 [Anaerolineales bacterium]